MRKTIPVLLSFLLFAGISLGQTTATSKSTSLRTSLQLKLEEWHKAGSFPGATLGVVLANGDSFGLAVGLADREPKTPMKPDSRMLAGSVG